MNNLAELEQVDVELVAKIYAEYKKLHLRYRLTKPFKFKAKPSTYLLLQYCSQLIPIAQRLAGYKPVAVPIGYKRLKKRLKGVLEIYIRNIYPNRFVFVQKIIQYLIKQIKKEGERLLTIPKGRKPFIQNNQVIMAGNQWIEELYNKVLAQLHFTGKDLELSKKLLEVMIRYGESTKVPKYIRDAVYGLVRKELLDRFGSFPWKVLNSRVQMLSRLLWKY